MKLPRGHRAQIDVRRKLIGYCLNPLHRTGRHKARVFASALGIDAGNAALLADALRWAAKNGDAKLKEALDDDAKYEITFQ